MASTYATPDERSFTSVEEYLRTSYRPDCDYVDGHIEERTLGEFEHSRVQLTLALIFGNHERDWAVITAPECRLQVGPNQYRVPDVMVLRCGTKVSRIVREAPLLCIEVLSPEDTWTKMRARLNDYLTLGVENIWCFDPDSREARRYTAGNFEQITEADVTVPGTPIRINIAEVFAVLDEQI